MKLLVSPRNSLAVSPGFWKLSKPRMNSLPRSISKLWVGAMVPIPTLTLEVAPFTPMMLPSTRELLAVTNALAPIAVALLTLPPIGALAPAPAPIVVVLLRVPPKEPVPEPKKVLYEPENAICPPPTLPSWVLLLPAWRPISVLNPTAVLLESPTSKPRAATPTAVLELPAVLLLSAPAPIAVLL